MILMNNCGILACGLDRGRILEQRPRLGVGLSRWWSWSECLRGHRHQREQRRRCRKGHQSVQLLVFVCAEVGSCTDNDAQGHGMVTGSDGAPSLASLNAMDEVLSSMERGTMWDTAVFTGTNDYDAIGPFAVADRASRAWLCVQNKTL